MHDNHSSPVLLLYNSSHGEYGETLIADGGSDILQNVSNVAGIVEFQFLKQKQ